MQEDFQKLGIAAVTAVLKHKVVNVHNSIGPMCSVVRHNQKHDKQVKLKSHVRRFTREC